MLELQHKPLYHETEYAIDVLLDEMEIDGATSMAIRLYGDRQIVNDIIDNRRIEDDELTSEYFRGVRQHKMAASKRLTAYASELIFQLPLDGQGAMASIALTHMDHVCRQTAEFMSRWAIGDKAEGGYAERYNRPPRVQKGTVLPYKKDWRRLHAPSWIRRYIKREEESHRVRATASRVLARIRHLDPRSIHGGVEVFRHQIDEAARRRMVYEDQQRDTIQEALFAGASAQEAIECRIKLKAKYRRIAHRKRKEARKVALRGLATAQTIVGPDKASAFVRGEPVVLEGVNLDLAVRRRHGVAHKDHGAIALQALAKGGEPLADLCFYVEDTPAIDQLTAIALHVQSGSEQDIISAANVISSTPAGLNHAAFVEKRTQQAQEMAQALILNGDRQPTFWPAHPQMERDFRELARERDKAYWKATQHIWLEGLGVFMLGPKYYKLAQEQGALVRTVP